MADDGKSIKELYDSAILEIQAIVGSVDATDAQRAAARQSLRDMTTMLLGHTIKTVEGRTALLAGLIVELGEVIDGVKSRPPYADVIKNLTTIADKAKTLLGDARKDLV